MLLAKEEGWQLDTLKASYAGPMGMGQFMPYSYRHYTVDFDGDDKRNLFANPADAIGSIANYFASHQWHWGEAVVEPAQIGVIAVDPLLRREPEMTQQC